MEIKKFKIKVDTIKKNFETQDSTLKQDSTL